MKICQFGNLEIGRIPRVVGIISSSGGLASFPSTRDPGCDVIEIRLDQIGTDIDWSPRSADFQRLGIPTLLTIRSVAEGGKWDRSDADRLNLFRQAISAVSAIDVELGSALAPQLAPTLAQALKALIISFHDFARTPEIGVLREVIRRASEWASVVKISTMVNTPADVDTLSTLLREPSAVPLCIIGMGALGRETRTDFPALGSCLTYGYLESPNAPGQLSARQLVSHLRQSIPAYAEDLIRRNRSLEFA